MSKVKLPEFEMHYVEQGTGDEVIVFVHGFVSSHRWWQPMLDVLPGNFHAYALDLRAAGNSEQVNTGHNIAQYAQDIEDFASAMGLGKFTLVGHSMGGGVAMQFAINQPQRLNALVLVDPLAPNGMRIDQATTDWINSVQGQEEGQRAIVIGAFATPPTGEFLEQLVDDAVACDSPAYHGTMDDMAKFDVSGELSKITVPTLVTWGDKDTVVPFEGIVEAFTKIPNSHLEIWHGVGHSAPIEIPERFVSVIAQFVAEVEQA